MGQVYCMDLFVKRDEPEKLYKLVIREEKPR